MNGAQFHEVKSGIVSGRGGALLASLAVQNSVEGAECLLTVPKDLILSMETIREHARSDRDFREVLESLGDFGRTPRGAILVFVLFQATVSSDDLDAHIGVHNPFTDYVKSLPLEKLPTFWSSKELRLLHGTTLAPATSAKLRSLANEYDILCTSALGTRWYATVQEHLDFDDWLQVDAMYRSRALEYPGIGHCMVPCIDLANHAAGEATIANYDRDADGNAVLVLREGKRLSEGDEVTITYGDEKGACEMLFSYGFLDSAMQSAGTLFLGLPLPGSDPAASAKLRAADCAPGVRLTDAGNGSIEWSGDFIWMLCVNADDGLQFAIARSTDGSKEIQALLNDEELTGGAAELHKRLQEHALWDVYHLRAVTILQQRLFDQLQLLYGSQDDCEAVKHGEGTEVRDQCFEQAMLLRRLEFELLEAAYEDFEHQKAQLVESQVVQDYLTSMNAAPAEANDTEGDDFS
ncbi:hypothetical protein B0A48_04302 [Cryoendolithus antarcticus]|uniref:SET domain-containing protein n=1 Tax=Cryoendolithus antarcticus TaxID=1507870 RepID=A0A1V8TEZ2_9PEZI|nr:hypothetical protein B0A48_04302 [Cryoendolithus antarcticus]